MEKGHVKTSVENGIARIEFFHPKGNSLPGELLDVLAQEISKAGKMEKVKVILLQSGGERTFCAGASFHELVNIQNEESGKRFFSGFARVIDTIRTSEVFVLCKVQGKAIGGGVGILCAADGCWATEVASVRLSELSLGIGPFVIEPAVKRRIGITAYTSLMMNPTSWRDAQWGLEKGMYQSVFSTIAELDKFLEQKCEELASYNKEAIVALKQSLWEGTEHWEKEMLQRAAISGKLVLSGDSQRVIRAILNKE